jgi:hypothetical protein
MRKKASAVFGVLLLLSTLFVLAQQNTPVDPVSWRELVPFMIDVSGWEAEGKPEGQSVSMGDFKISQAEREYTAGDRSLNVSLVDGGFVPMVYAGIKMAMNFEVDSSEEYIKKIEVNGFPGVEQYNYESKEAELMILIAERFLLHFEGENFDNDASELVTIAAGFDLAGIAALAD